MAGLLQDVRFALRQLRKTPGFTITATAMLAVAICANGTVFSWIDGTMLHPIPGARDQGALVSVMRGQWSVSPAPPFSYPDYRDLRDQNHSFEGILGYHHDWLTVTSGAVPERVYVANVTANYFDVLGVKPLYGRFFRPEEETAGRNIPYVVLSYSFWKTHYAGDPGIVGKSNRDCAPPGDRDRRGAEGVHRRDAGAAAGYVGDARSAGDEWVADDASRRTIG